jgi:hypothetical protein
VELSARLRPQTLLWLRLQTDRGPIEVEAQVAWIGGRPPAGGGILQGLAFRQIAPDQLRTLRDLLRLPRLLPPGTTLEVTLRIANNPLTAEGTVVWVDPPEIWTPGKPIGHGFQFTAPRWTTMLSLGLLLADPA